VVVLTDSPSLQDDLNERLFSDEKGRFLNWALGEAGVLRHQVWATAVVMEYCNNELEFEVKAEEGKKALDEELEDLKRRGFTTIIALGSQSALSLGIDISLKEARGSTFLYKDFVVVPTFHPAEVYSVKGGKKRDGSKGNFKYVWLADLKKAVDIAKYGWKPPKENFVLSPTIEDIKEWFKEHDGKQLAVDIETTGFNRDYSEIVVIGFAADEANALSVPFLTQGGSFYFSNGKRREVKDFLGKVFSSRELIFQNALFDVPYLRAKGFKLPWANVKHDTMILHHTISPELPHKLGFIVSVYGTTSYWKEDFIKREGGILEMPDDVVRTYNLRDCVVLHQVLKPMLEDLRNDGLEYTYYHEAMPLVEPVAEMQEAGVLLDKKKLERWVKDSKKRLGELNNELRTLCSLPDAFSFNSNDDMRFLIYNQKPAKFAKLNELDDYRERKWWRYNCENPDCKKRTFWADTADGAACPKCHHASNVKTGEEKVASKKKKATKKYEALRELEEIATQTEPLYRPPGFTPRFTKDSGQLAVNQQALLGLQLAT
jgi:uracil-DNA glycosylase